MDVLSTSLVAGVNVYYLEIYVTVAADGTIEEVVPTVHVQSWDGPKTSDPGWRIEWDEELYALFNGNAYGSSLGYLPGYGVPGALGNRGGYGYVSRGSNASGQGGPAGTSDGTGPSGTASGSNAAASSGGGSSAAGAGANAGSGATGAGAAGAAGGITDGAAGATAGTNVVGDRGASDGLATTGDVTSAVLPLALSAMLLISAGLTRHAHGKGEDR